jgi:CHAT domain-containing protein
MMYRANDTNVEGVCPKSKDLANSPIRMLLVIAAIVALAATPGALRAQSDDLATAERLNSQVVELYSAGHYREAIPLAQQVLTIYEKVLGPEHPNMAISLNNLALLYWSTGAYAQAEPLYKRALTIYEKVLGPEHPNTALSLANLATLSWERNRWSESFARTQRFLSIEESNAQRILLLGNESRKRAYADTLTDSTWAAVSFSLASHGKVPLAERLGLEVVLQRKGRVQDLMADVFAVARASLSASDREVFDAWREANAQLATLSFRGPEHMPLATYRERLEALREKAASLETRLSTRSAEFRSKVEAVTVESVQRALPAGSVLIEWLRYQPFNPKATGKKPRWGNPRYVAFVLKPEGPPVAVDIGEAQPIETLLSDLLAALRVRGTLVSKLARKLDAQLMQPLHPYLGNAERLLLSPDGQLNLLPFGVLRDEQGRYLVQQKGLIYLTSGRDLLRPASTVPSRQAPLVLAAPDFGPPGEFTPLPGTTAEAQALKTLLGLKDDGVLTGSRATEAVLKQAQGPRILHLATHGFFLADQPVKPETFSAARARGEQLLVPKGENPLLRSGLALAAANQLRSGGDDGILTAAEVTGLDLQGTELAVLSACETGVGKIHNGEGVYGLRRAFVLAGVRTQVVSLWKVDDAATKELMSDYYKRLNTGAGRSQALRSAQLAMLADPRRAHPYYWAAFVLIGEGAPMKR